jgi:acid stress-induced BolA-like protein IbaG/YrbA
VKILIVKFRNVLSGCFLKRSWDNIKKADVLVVRHDADCGYQYEGKAYSPIADSIVEGCVKEMLSVCSVATPFSRLFGAHAFNSPIVLNRSFLWIALCCRILSLFIGGQRSKKWTASQRTKLWRRVLDRIEPGMVIGIQPDVDLCRACRALNVPVFDFQHGVIAPDHWWYDKKMKNDIADDALPSGFLGWDDHSMDTLARWAPARGSSVRVVGNPWFQRFQYPDDKDQLVQDALGQGHVYTNNRPTILVSLQWGLHVNYYPENDFNKVMCHALETAIKQTHGEYNWLLRLHPVQLRGQEGHFCEEYLSREFGNYPNVEWHRVSRLPLPVLLKQSDLHITDMSTVVTEASWLGVPSALLNPHLNKGGSIENLYQQVRQSGMATLLPQEGGAIESWIKDKLQSKDEVDGHALPVDGFRCWLKEMKVING